MRKIILVIILLFMPFFSVNAIENEFEIDDYLIENEQNMEKLSINNIYKSVINTVKIEFKEPLQVMTKIFAILLFSALVKSFTISQSDYSINYALNIVVIVSVFLIVCDDVLKMFSLVKLQLFECSNFIATFSPIFCTVIASSGQPSTAIVYSGMFFTTLMAITSIITNVITPFTNIYLALSTSAQLTPDLNLNGLTQIIGKVLKWGMGFMATIFCTVLGLQSFIANASDTIILRAGKFVVGNAVPIIGRTVSDALNMVYTGFKIAKGTVGIAGIIGVTVVLFPVFIKCVMYYFSILIAGTLAKILDNKVTENILHSLNECTLIYISIIILYYIMIIFSIILMMAINTGG